MRSTWIGVWLSGAVLALSLLAGTGAASAAPARGVVAQSTCPTDPYTGAATNCNTGVTSGNAGTGQSGVPSSGAAPSTSPGNGGALASTGADILVALLAAALLILLGTTLILAARERRQTA